MLSLSLFFTEVEGVVLHVGFYALFFQVEIVFFGAIAGIGSHFFRELSIGISKALKVRDQRTGVGGIGVKGVIEDELLVGGEL